MNIFSDLVERFIGSEPEEDDSGEFEYVASVDELSAEEHEGEDGDDTVHRQEDDGS